MRCAKCGAELKVGSIYCAKCGREAQIVSDSSLLEEDLLMKLLQEENEAERAKKAPPKKDSPKTTQKKKKNHLPLILSLSCLAVLIAAAVILIVTIRNNNRNSYDYQVSEAEACMAEQDYAKAMSYYERALELKEGDIPVRFSMAKLALIMEDEKEAIRILKDILVLERGNREACQKLIEIYEQEKDYEAVLALKEEVEDEELLTLFEAYEAAPPVLSLKPGTYPEYITVELTASEGDEIYYTTNGRDPAEQGSLYEEPIKLEEQGTLTLRAVAKNQYGLYSEEITGDYTVAFQKPKMPKATPERGRFTEPVTIQLDGPEGSRMYYTWDGSVPTVASTEYTGPIPVPEGNNILSVILVDKYGMTSDVLKCNYEYFPMLPR